MISTDFYVYEGDSIGALTGVLHFTYDNFKLEPRDSADFYQYASLISKASDLTEGSSWSSPSLWHLRPGQQWKQLLG